MCYSELAYCQNSPNLRRSDSRAWHAIGEDGVFKGFVFSRWAIPRHLISGRLRSEVNEDGNGICNLQLSMVWESIELHPLIMCRVSWLYRLEKTTSQMYVNGMNEKPRSLFIIHQYHLRRKCLIFISLITAFSVTTEAYMRQKTLRIVQNLTTINPICWIF